MFAQVLCFVLFMALGLIGAAVHYAKKRYKDKTLCCSLFNYLKTNQDATILALSAIAAAEFALAGLHAGSFMDTTFTELGMAYLGGYKLDSVFNKAEEDAKN